MHDRMRGALGLALGIAVLSGACSSGVAATAPPEVEGTTWRAVEIDGLPTLGKRPEMSIDGGRLRGDTGCNAVSAAVTLTEGQIDIGDVNSTLRLCQGEAGEVETRFLRALVGATSVSFDETGTLLLHGEGGVSARFAGN